jgi:hypothetical protein
MKKMNDFWTICVEDAELQWHMFAIQSKGECFLSANTKLVSIDKAVQLSSEELARSFCEAVLPTLRRRHGEAVSAVVAIFRTTGSRIDDSLVQARIKERLFAPNKRPPGLASAEQFNPLRC